MRPPRSAAPSARLRTWASVKRIRTGPCTVTSALVEDSFATVAIPLSANTFSADLTEDAVKRPPNCPAGMIRRPDEALWAAAGGAHPETMRLTAPSTLTAVTSYRYRRVGSAPFPPARCQPRN